MPRDLAAVLDIADAVRLTLEFSEGVDRDAFLAHKTTRWAIYSQLVIIGEAAGRVSREFANQHPEVPWSQMTGMRHRLIHGYDEINWERVWETVTEDLPKLLQALKPLIPLAPSDD